MNTKNAARTLVSKLQRILLAVMLAAVVFSTLPVEKAHALANFDGSVRCDQGYYKYTFYASGDYPGQLIAFRFREYRVNRDYTLTFVKMIPASSFYYVQATSTDTNSMNAAINTLVVPASKNTFVMVQTEVWFYDSVARKYQGPYYGVGKHYPFISKGLGPSTACQIW
jgi:hypothetical protein